MTNEILTEIACPNCLNPIDVRQHGRHITCDACQSQFILEGHICANCNAYHRQEQAFCRECGTAMTRICQNCQEVNWAGDEYCQQCGGALDIFQLLHMHHKHATAERLQEQIEMSQTIKQQEKIDSEKRMAKLLEIEHHRQQELAQRRRQQQKKDRQLFIIVGIIATFVMIIMILYTVLF